MLTAQTSQDVLPVAFWKRPDGQAAQPGPRRSSEKVPAGQSSCVGALVGAPEGWGVGGVEGAGDAVGAKVGQSFSNQRTASSSPDADSTSTSPSSSKSAA